jgi:taurine dioxygenase
MVTTYQHISVTPIAGAPGLESPDCSRRSRWRKNSLAMGDHRRTQHRVVADNLAAYRRMERVTVMGDRPF